MLSQQIFILLVTFIWLELIATSFPNLDGAIVCPANDPLSALITGQRRYCIHRFVFSMSTRRPVKRINLWSYHFLMTKYWMNRNKIWECGDTTLSKASIWIICQKVRPFAEKRFGRLPASASGLEFALPTDSFHNRIEPSLLAVANSWCSWLFKSFCCGSAHNADIPLACASTCRVLKLPLYWSCAAYRKASVGLWGTW